MAHEEPHRLVFKHIYTSKKRPYLGLFKTRQLVDNEQYEFRFEVTNIGDKPFPGGEIEFEAFSVDVQRPSPGQPPQTLTVGPGGAYHPTFQIPYLKPGEKKTTSIHIVEFYTVGSIKMTGTAKSKDNRTVIHHRAGERRPNGSWPGVSSGYEVYFRVNNHNVIITRILLYIGLITLIIVGANFILAWQKDFLEWILNLPKWILNLPKS